MDESNKTEQNSTYNQEENAENQPRKSVKHDHFVVHTLGGEPSKIIRNLRKSIIEELDPRKKSIRAEQQQKAVEDNRRKSVPTDRRRKSISRNQHGQPSASDPHRQSTTSNIHRRMSVPSDNRNDQQATTNDGILRQSISQRKKSLRYGSVADVDHRYSVADNEVDFDGFKMDAEVAAKLHKLQNSSRVAFLSSTDRRYYPEFPGHSRFAQEFQAHLADPSLPPPEFYVPPEADRLNKPLSKKGYGIGGLSASRFPRLNNEKIPAPNQYQRHVRELLTRQHRFPPRVWMNYGLLGENDKIWDEKVARKLFTLWGKCHQINVGFGQSTKEPRFGKDPKWNCAGPGTYALRKLKLDTPRVFNAFLKGPSVFNPATKLHCSYGPKDRCIECDVQLMSERDYYRSRFRVNPVPLRPIVVNTDDQLLKELEENTKKKMTARKDRASRVLLCRNCYCNALRGGSRFWKTKAEIEWLFEKTRHCGYLHQHNDIPEYTLKASCYWTRNLARKESILSKHYPDVCEKRIVPRRQQ